VFSVFIFCVEAPSLCTHLFVFKNHHLLSSLFLLSGTIGHVAHGKSTVVKAISGVQTVRFKNELERNITIKLGK
jgi:hypothetical protein